MDTEKGQTTGLKIACLMFLFPFNPHNWLNYIMGVTHLSFKHFIYSNFAKIMDTAALVWIGSTIAALNSASDVKESI